MKARKEDNSKTWREYYAPIIWKTICEHMKNHPEWSMEEIRRKVFAINPGAYHWQRRVWTSEVSGQIKHFAEVRNKQTLFGYEEENFNDWNAKCN